MSSYRKRSYRKGSRSKSRSYARKPSLQQQLRQLKAALPKAEYKVQDTAISANPVITPNTPILLNTIAQDTSADGRVGNKYDIKTIQFKLMYTMNASATDTIVRTIIYYDKQCNAATAAITGNLLVGESVTSLKQPNNNYRFMTLYDKNVSMCSTASTEAYRQYYKRHNLRVQCNNSTADTIAAIETGALYIVFISDEATNTPTVSGSVRIWYTDS